MDLSKPLPPTDTNNPTEIKKLPLLFKIILVLYILPLLASIYALSMYFTPNSYFAESTTIQNLMISLFMNAFATILTFGAYLRNKYALMCLLIFPFIRLIINIFLDDKQNFNVTTASLSAFLLSGLLLFSIRKHWSEFK